MRPRVHHLEGSEPVYDGADVFRAARRSGRSVDGLCLFLADNPLIDWRGYFRETFNYGHDYEDALRFVRAAYQKAFGQDIRDSELWDGLVRVANEAYGA